MSEENTQTAEAQNTNSNKKKRAEVTIKRQIKTYAVKYLTDLANNDHARTGVYVAPTQEAIAAECKKRWQQHLNRSLPKEDISVYFD